MPPPHPQHHELARRRPGGQLARTGVEVGERAGEHHLGEGGVGRHEAAEGQERRLQVRPGVARVARLGQVPVQQPEAAEEHLADEPGLVAEQLVHRGQRRLRLPGDAAGGEALHPVADQHRDRRVEHPVT
jgi:hypothetical protein